MTLAGQEDRLLETGGVQPLLAGRRTPTACRKSQIRWSLRAPEEVDAEVLHYEAGCDLIPSVTGDIAKDLYVPPGDILPITAPT